MLLGGGSLHSQAVLGPTTDQLARGDFVLPRFSPKGRLLAVSQVLADTATETTRILLLDLQRNRVDTLLSDNAAEKYATYKAYVSEFQWVGDTILKASIPDGDVGVTEVMFDVRSRSILQESHEEGGEDDPHAPYRALADSLADRYPETAPIGRSASDVFVSGLSWPTVRGPGFILLQKRYAGVDDDIWLYRLDRHEATSVLHLTGGVRSTLAGGFVAGGDILFAAGTDTVGVYRYRNNKLAKLFETPVRPQFSRLSVRTQRGDSVWFVLTLHQPYERGANRAFLYDGERLVPITGYDQLVDIDVNLQAHRIAVLFWAGAERHVAVREVSK